MQEHAGIIGIVGLVARDTRGGIWYGRAIVAGVLVTGLVAHTDTLALHDLHCTVVLYLVCCTLPEHHRICIITQYLKAVWGRLNM